MEIWTFTSCAITLIVLVVNYVTRSKPLTSEELEEQKLEMMTW